MQQWGRAGVIAGALWCLAGSVFASPAATSTAAAVPLALDQTTTISSYCTSHFAREERLHGIPKHLMLAVSATESGRWNDKVGMVLPWPWTINADGKGYYFETKHEAVTAAKRLLENGANNLDVGCMQISLKHHPKAFASLSEAFDPSKNVAYAAKFLKGNYEEVKSWTRAVANYHSKTPEKGNQYFGLVKRNWKKIITALGSSSYDSLPYLRFAGLSPDQSAVDLVDGYENEVGFPSAKSGVSVNRAVSIRRLPRMKVIKVTRVQDMADARPTDAVLVVRPMKDDGAKKAYQKPTIVNAGNRKNSPIVLVTRPVDESPKVATATVDRSSSSGTQRSISVRRGPNFIFE